MHLVNNFFEKVYVINLISERERLNKTTKKLNNLGIKFDVFPAIEYKFFDKHIQKFNNNNERPAFTFPNEIGCAISHYSIIKEAKINNYKNVLIFEDDVSFRKDFNDIIDLYLEKMPKDWDMVYFYSGIYRWYPNRHRWIKGSRYLYFTSFETNGCIAYAINNKFYDVLLDNYDNNFQIADNLCNKIQSYGTHNIYSVFPNLCAQDINTSTINPDKTNLIDVYKYMVTFGKLTKDDYL